MGFAAAHKFLLHWSTHQVRSMPSSLSRPITASAFSQPWAGTLRASEFRESRRNFGLSTDTFAANYAEARFASNPENIESDRFERTQGFEPSASSLRHRPFGSSHKDGMSLPRPSSSLPRPPIAMASSPDQERMLATITSHVSATYTPSPALKKTAFRAPISNYKSMHAYLNPTRLSQPSIPSTDRA